MPSYPFGEYRCMAHENKGKLNYVQDNKACVLKRPILISITDNIRNKEKNVWSPKASLSGFGLVCGNISTLWRRKGDFQTCGNVFFF